MPVYTGINWHQLVFATDWQKLGLCRHFAYPDLHNVVTIYVYKQTYVLDTLPYIYVYKHWTCDYRYT